MIERPTDRWRRERAAEDAKLAAGVLDAAAAYAAQLWPDGFVVAVDAELDAFDHATRLLDVADDDAVWSVVERVVRDLNGVHAEWALIETGEREELCHYIEELLVDTGVDLEALTAARGLGPHELTDEWRDW